MKTFVIRKDTKRKKVQLYQEGAKTAEWVSYEKEEDYQDFPGWVSAADSTYSIANQQIKQAQDYEATYKPAKPADTPKHKFSGVNYDEEAPYGLWAKHALFKVKDYLNACCWTSSEDPTDLSFDGYKRDQLFLTIDTFLNNSICGKPASLELPGVPIGHLSNILLQLGLYLGNFEHEDQQIKQKLGLDE